MFALLVDTRLSARLSDLPLVRDHICPDHDLGITNVRAVIASSALTAELVQSLNGRVSHLDDGRPVFPEEARGHALVALDYAWGNEQRAPLVFRLARGKSAEESKEPAVGDGPSRVFAAFASDETDAAAVPAVAWAGLDRSVGSLHLRLLGATYRDGKVWVLCDAGVHAGPLDIEVDGLGLGIPLDGGRAPVGRLDGLSLTFDKPPLAMSGAFVNRPVTDTSPYRVLIEGSALVRTPAAGFTAIGAYQVLRDGTQSLFLYAELGAKFGGPPAFRVTGLKAGFGYNSSLRVPTIDQVADFPLLRGVDDAGNGAPLRPLEMLAKLTEGSDSHPAWVTPRDGATWLAFGLNAEVFGTVHCKALAFAEFGAEDLVVGLLGSVKARFPDPKKKSAKPYAGVDLAISAVYRRSADMLAVDARLSPDSFLLDPSVHLTGGAALRLWFGGSDHPGDFVFTVGGYHPRYTPPAHYPRVDPVGVDWAPDSSVTLKGTSYFALTPSAVMAGGRLALRYDGSWAKARVDVGFDALVEWAPFHYEFDVWADITAQVWLAFGWSGEKSLGARLSVWGPPFGGTAHVKVLGIDIPIDFGESRARPAPIGWEQFRTLLPQQPLTLAPVDGLHPDHAAAARQSEPAGSDSDASRTWHTTCDGFAFTVSSAVPASVLKVKVNGGDRTEGGGARVNIRPMRKAGLEVPLLVTVEKERPGGGENPPTAEVQPDWGVTVHRTPQPAALWGTGSADGALTTEDPFVRGLVSGARISVPAPRLPEDPESSARGRLGHSPPREGTLPLDPAAAATGARGEASDSKALKDDMADPAKRQDAIAALAAAGYLLEGAGPELDRYADEAAFSSLPLRLTRP